jgi:tRNA(Ile)-lysidine synthase
MHPEPDLHSLPPAWARFCLEVERFVQESLGADLRGAQLIAAFSGGVDSTALLLLLRAMRSRWRASITAVHLDHRLRPEATEEARQAQQLCRQLGIPCHTAASRVATYAERRGMGLEEAGRLIRYRLLFGLRRRWRADFVLTAHQLNDLAEDQIMRQLRGAGWPALAGMPAHEPASGLLRPLLLQPKQSLIDFVSQLGLSWSEDSSNLALDRLRNRVRQRILPELLRENPRYLENVARIWRQAELDRDFWSRTLHRLSALEKHDGETLLLPNEMLTQEHKAVRLRWYKQALARLGPGQILAESLHKLDAAWLAKHRGKTLQFPGRKRASIEPGGICFFVAETNVS